MKYVASAVAHSKRSKFIQSIQESGILKRSLGVSLSEDHPQVHPKSVRGLFFTSSGKLVGFSDLGPVNNEMVRFEQGLKNQDTKLATHVFVLMARGLFSGMKFPFA